MNTPIYDYLKRYAASGMLRGHMPGHKGVSPVKGLESLYSLDITEISGADSLFEADGIILESERNMSSLYGSTASFYSAEGSTLCIQAMLAAVKFENRTVIAARNVHRSFLNAAALLGLDVEWLIPEYSDGILSGRINLVSLEEILRRTNNPCVYITSPDYTGRTADITGISALCRKYGAPLLADNAHGPHLRFMPEDIHPITLGADMCCDSAHKMLPALTGAAVLHTSSEKYAGILRHCMSMFASTSPSYLIMASLDLCCPYLADRIRGDIEEKLPLAERYRSRFADRLAFAEGDPFHITIKAAESGLDGLSLAQSLRENGAECEYADRDTVILLMSPSTPYEDFARLEDVTEKALLSAVRTPPRKNDFRAVLPEKAMSIRQAFFSPSETINVDDAEGRICASVLVPCPPAIPIAASGEIIDRECIGLFRRYGISRVIVVK
ncbi:aminotransferase class V-fold PLP-dependent enzyme [Ruminococcus sp. XPD3002]|uniref:aminotransferase class V-fold PLP-dependent enzyme n=1 Tax=Ruminococcus sp. XPD3002 TaxID=1452269 RepID=UPI0009127039|nr:Arginine/lysine/ornithine decarboxylase [Ruminococcus flavefaciens]